MRREERGPWYLLTGVILGVIAGLLYAWQVQPTRYVDTDPASLRADFKDRYRALIAAAYTANGDLVRAQARLDLLEDPDLFKTLAEQAQRTLADGRELDEARALGLLAVALGQGPEAAHTSPPSSTSPTPENASPTIAGTPADTLTPASSLTATVASSLLSSETITATSPVSGTAGITTTLTSTRTPRPTRTPTPTRTPLPTRTPTPTQAAPFILDNQDQICDQPAGENLIQVEAFNAAGEPISGVEVIVVWEGGEDHFFTGLKPEISYGYADFQMTPAVLYTVRLTDGEAVPNISSFECETSSGERYWGIWSLDFVQP